jgi:glycosyltransferase involved in cell wall biosynthesis
MSKYGDKNMRKDYTASRRYILTTPVKNEEKNLPKLIESIVKQTVRPLLWAIVDDGSIDKSPKIIKEAKDKYNWIQSIWLNDTIRDRGLHLATVMKKGFDFAIEYCKKNGIVFDYLGNVDADAILEDSSFKNLIKKFESNPKLGIGSCGDWLIKGDQMKYIKERLPAGGNVLYRKKCF